MKFYKNFNAEIFPIEKIMKKIVKKFLLYFYRKLHIFTIENAITISLHKV